MRAEAISSPRIARVAKDGARGDGSPPSSVKGTTVRVATGRSSLGHVLTAATRRGVCAVALGDDPEGLLRDLRARFPTALLLADDGTVEELSAAVVARIDGARGGELPLDLRLGTPFQRKVWDALRRVPWGATVTYTDVAREIGAPRSTRAVGSACGRNPVAVLVPCHRVLRGDGGLGGYRWGEARKRALLAREVGVRGELSPFP